MILALLTFQKVLPMSPVLATERPFLFHAAGPGVLGTAAALSAAPTDRDMTWLQLPNTRTTGCVPCRYPHFSSGISRLSFYPGKRQGFPRSVCALVIFGKQKTLRLAAKLPRMIALGASPGNLGDDSGKLRSSDVNSIAA